MAEEEAVVNSAGHLVVRNSAAYTWGKMSKWEGVERYLVDFYRANHHLPTSMSSKMFLEIFFLLTPWRIIYIIVLRLYSSEAENDQAFRPWDELFMQRLAAHHRRSLLIATWFSTEGVERAWVRIGNEFAADVTEPSTEEEDFISIRKTDVSYLILLSFSQRENWISRRISP